MKYVIISASHRKKSQSAKVARFCEHLIRNQDSQSTVEILDLAENPLPLWDESVWEKDQKWNSNWIPMRDMLRRAEAIVLVSPEWAGMVPAGLKNLLLFCGNSELGHKPALIVTVSSGMGGSYPNVELRMSGYKNNRMCYIPDHVIIRKVEEVLNDTLKAESNDDERIRKRLDYSLAVLHQYGLALNQVRASSIINFKDFANGM